MTSNKPPSICIIDDSPLTTHLYKYLFGQLMTQSTIYTFTHPNMVNINKFQSCDLIVIDEIMEGMTGTHFIHHSISNFFNNRLHEFPNVIFVSSLDKGDMHERIKSLGLDHLIPAYRVLEKPLSPAVIRSTIVSICPSMAQFISANAMVPDSNLPWRTAISSTLHEIFRPSSTKRPQQMIAI